MVMVRPIWLCTCFSKDQAPLVDDLLTKLIYLKTVENVCSFGNWALEVMLKLPSDSIYENGLQGGLVKCSLFWTKLLH